MKKSFLFIITAVLLIIMIGCGSEKKKEEKSFIIPVQFAEGGKWGYVDMDGNIIIDTLFANTPSYFREGFALIKIAEGEYDFIDETGKKMGKKYADASLFSEGLACVVEKNGYPYFINNKFSKVFELKDAYMVGMFSEGMARFRDKAGKWGFIDNSGKVVIKPQFDNVMNFSEKFAVVMVKENDSVSKLGFINIKGEYVLKLTDSVKSLQPFREGLAAYNNGKGWGFLGYDTKPVIPCSPDREEVTPFHSGFASFKEGGEWGAINSKGEKIFLPVYSMPIKFFDGIAVITEDNKYGFMNDKEEIVVKTIYKEVGIPYFSGNAIVKAGKNYVMINSDGKQIAGKSYKNVNPMFISVEEELQTVMSNTPEIVAMHKALTDSLNALQKSQAAVADSLAQQQQMMQQQSTLQQQMQQQQMMQQQMQQQMMNIGPKELAMKMAEATESIMKEGNGNIERLAQGLVSLQNQAGMILQKKQTDKKFMEEFQKEMLIYYKPVEEKYKDEFVKVQQYVMKKQQEWQEKQKSQGK